jgi:hypothetical protein
MATVKTPSFVTRLKNALISDLRTADIPARVAYERVPTTRLFRFAVLAERFDALPHSERQGLVWRIVERTLPPEEQLLISGILTLTPEEAGEVPTTASTRVAKRAGRR